MLRDGGSTLKPAALNDVALELAENWERDGWGRYESAIRRWEQVLGRPAPFPGERGNSGRYRLAVDFTEWCQGLPIGWVAGTPDLPYAGRIRALGNGVVPRQGAAALRLLIGLAALPAPRPQMPASGRQRETVVATMTSAGCGLVGLTARAETSVDECGRSRVAGQPGLPAAPPQREAMAWPVRAVGHRPGPDPRDRRPA
jgi:hypothetical protein